MIPVKMCPRCGIEPSVSHQRVYCRFCQQRYQRVRQLYVRGGKRLRLHQLHRSWNNWRRTPELDALYLDRDEVAA